DAYLSGARELREGNFGTPVEVDAEELLGALTPSLFFDAVAVRIDGPRAWDLDLAARWIFPDRGETYRSTLRNGVFSAIEDGKGDVSLTVTVPDSALAALAAGQVDQALAAGLQLDGQADDLQRVLGVLQPGDPGFSII